MSKTISFLCNVDPGLACLAGHVLMTVQHHLGGEGRIAADLDGDVAPEQALRDFRLCQVFFREVASTGPNASAFEEVAREEPDVSLDSFAGNVSLAI